MATQYNTEEPKPHINYGWDYIYNPYFNMEDYNWITTLEFNPMDSPGSSWTWEIEPVTIPDTPTQEKENNYEELFKKVDKYLEDHPSLAEILKTLETIRPILEEYERIKLAMQPQVITITTISSEPIVMQSKEEVSEFLELIESTCKKISKDIKHYRKENNG